MPNSYEVQDLVWAKMKGFPPWPGRVAEPPALGPKKPKGEAYYIYFFGTHDYAWIEEKCISSYDGSSDKEKKPKADKKLTAAIQEIEKYVQRKAEGKEDEPEEEESPFDDLLKNDDLAEGADTPPVKEKKKDKEKKKRARESVSCTISTKRPRSSVRENGDAEYAISQGSTSTSQSPRVSAARHVLDSQVPDEPQRQNILSVLTSDPGDVQATDLRIGFLGLGNMGSGMVMNLLRTKHDVTVWNRGSERVDPFLSLGAKAEMTPMDVVEKCDIIISCLSDPRASKELVFGNCGVMHGMKKEMQGRRKSKAYVEMTTIDPATSQEISDCVLATGSRYLEAPVIGSSQLANEGKLIVVASGDMSVFDDIQSVLQAISAKSFFQGVGVGRSATIALAISMFNGVCKAALGETLGLVEKQGIPLADMIEIFKESRYASPGIIDNCEDVLAKRSEVRHSVGMQQKDMRLCLEMADEAEIAMNVAAAANETYKHAKQKGYKEHDVCLIMCHKRL